MNKITVGAIIVLLLAFGGVVFWSTHNGERPAEVGGYDSTKLISATEDNGNIADHVHGKQDSPVVFVEYADLQCPGCAATYPIILDLYEDYGDRVAFVYRNFPLTMHQNARAAGTAAESAGFQGYYWQMLEELYSARDSWMNLTGSARTDKFAEIFAKVAPEGNIEKFRSDMGNKDIEKKLNFDYNLGVNQDKVDATPAIRVNGNALDMDKVQTQDDMKSEITRMLDSELKKNGMETGAKKK